MSNSKNWCKGFCRTCGTGCAEYCEQIHNLQADVAAMRDALRAVWHEGVCAGDLKDKVSNALNGDGGSE
jgi:hypothetical protein